NVTLLRRRHAVLPTRAPPVPAVAVMPRNLTPWQPSSLWNPGWPSTPIPRSTGRDLPGTTRRIMARASKLNLSPVPATHRPMTHHLRHLTTLEGIDSATLNRLLDRADAMREASHHGTRKLDLLQGRTVLNLFFEPS